MLIPNLFAVPLLCVAGHLKTSYVNTKLTQIRTLQLKYITNSLYLQYFIQNLPTKMCDSKISAKPLKCLIFVKSVGKIRGVLNLFGLILENFDWHADISCSILHISFLQLFYTIIYKSIKTNVSFMLIKYDAMFK